MRSCPDSSRPRRSDGDPRRGAGNRSTHPWRQAAQRYLFGVVAAASAVCLVQGSPTLAQLPMGDPEPYRSAIDRIDFLVGEWEGSGWMAFGPDQREEFTSREIVEERLGGSVLLVEGIHRAPAAEGSGERLVHHALATIGWSAAEQEYRFASTLYNRDGGTYRGWVDDDGAFVWQLEVAGRIMRYVIHIDAQGRWVEDGKISMDQGGNWFPFFHMTLERVGGAPPGDGSER